MTGTAASGNGPSGDVQPSTILTWTEWVLDWDAATLYLGHVICEHEERYRLGPVSMEALVRYMRGHQYECGGSHD